MQQPEAERRVLLVIDTSTRRIVSTRPLQASTNADLLLAEYMSYQQAVQAEEDGEEAESDSYVKVSKEEAEEYAAQGGAGAAAGTVEVER